MNSPSKQNSTTSSVEEKPVTKVAGPMQMGKYAGIILMIVVVLILLQNFFKSSAPEHKEQTPIIQAADTTNVRVDLGDNDSAAKLRILPPPPVHLPPVLPPPDFVNNAERSLQEETRIKSPSLVYSADTNKDATKSDENTNTGNANLSFADQISNSKITIVKAKQQTQTNYKIFQGKVIPAILETAINSDLPGMVRALVNEDVYGETGNIVLLPKGTRLIGQYNSQIATGQTRVFIIWSRAITPNNIDIAIGSPNTNALGEAGMEGTVDTHFWKVFGTSMLLSVIGAAASEVGTRNSNSEIGVYGNPYQTAVTQGILNSSNSVLQNNVNIQPTIHVDQGSIIKVFVARDLDFSGINGAST